MSNPTPILITGAGGQVGSVSTTMVHMLLAQGQAVRAFVRRDDERAQALRRAGAEVFVGDLLDPADVAAALKGCRRVFFSMSLNAYYVDANLLMAAAAREQGDIEAFVNISEYEQSYMTFAKMSAPREQRQAWLGGLLSDWSPQQRAHWLAEQALNWSGLPVVHVRATIFVENPILTWFPLQNVLTRGELQLPFGARTLAPIVGYDVAELCAKILLDPAPHISKAYELTGAELMDMHGLAAAYSAVLGRPVTYVPQDLAAWCETYIDKVVAARDPHIAAHLGALARLVAGGRYEVVSDELERLLGRPPNTVRWALERHPRLRQALEAA